MIRRMHIDAERNLFVFFFIISKRGLTRKVRTNADINGTIKLRIMKNERIIKVKIIPKNRYL